MPTPVTAPPEEKAQGKTIYTCPRHPQIERRGMKANPPAPEPAVVRPWYSPSGLWRRRTTGIAALAVAGIIFHLVLRFGFRTPQSAYQIPLLTTLVIGGLPLLYDLLRKLLKREFGSDLLGGISVVTSVLLSEYLAGSIIVLMLAGGESF